MAQKIDGAKSAYVSDRLFRAVVRDGVMTDAQKLDLINTLTMDQDGLDAKVVDALAAYSEGEYHFEDAEKLRKLRSEMIRKHGPVDFAGYRENLTQVDATNAQFDEIDRLLAEADDE